MSERNSQSSKPDNPLELVLGVKRFGRIDFDHGAVAEVAYDKRPEIAKCKYALGIALFGILAWFDDQQLEPFVRGLLRGAGTVSACIIALRSVTMRVFTSRVRELSETHRAKLRQILHELKTEVPALRSEVDQIQEEYLPPSEGTITHP